MFELLEYTKLTQCLFSLMAFCAEHIQLLIIGPFITIFYLWAGVLRSNVIRLLTTCSAITTQYCEGSALSCDFIL